jgi:hypothetical protein
MAIWLDWLGYAGGLLALAWVGYRVGLGRGRRRERRDHLLRDRLQLAVAHPQLVAAAARLTSHRLGAERPMVLK